MLKDNLQSVVDFQSSNGIQNVPVSPKGRILISTTVPEMLVTVLKNQPRYLARYFQVSLATGPGKGFHQLIQNEGLEIFQVPMERGISVLKDLKSVVRMVLVLRKFRPEIVQSYSPKAGLVCMLAARLCGVPIRVHTFTGLIFPTTEGFKKNLLIWVDRLTCLCATHIVPEGEGVKKDLLSFRITQKPLQVIGYGNIAGVNTSYFSPTASGVAEAATQLRQALAITSDDFLFCFVGRLNKDKGLAELIKAFQSSSPVAHLVLVGDVDQTAPVDAATLATIKTHPRVHWLGFVNDIRPALQAANVLILPSYREGFPNVVLQAGAMELPVIASDINGCNEVIEYGFNGWLVPPRDATALVGAMQQAIEMPTDVRNKLGRQARVRIRQRFEQQQHWERMVLFYQELLFIHQMTSK